jgi:hypothetical protein
MAYYILDGGKRNKNNMNDKSNQLNVVDDNIDKFKDVYPEIMKKVNKQKLDIIEPRITEVNSVYALIKEFIISKKRKIYGGYALNLLIMQKNKSLAFYDESDTPDIDFYSPEPLKDLKELCDIIHNAGFSPVTGQEAQHKETYAIFVNYKEYCNISYMPYNIYNKLKFIEYAYNGSKTSTLVLTHPWFMMIDYFRMFTDPMISFWRLEKTYERYILLQKTYPLPLIKSPLIIPEYKNNEVTKYMTLLFNEISSYDTLIFTGFYVYNYYLEHSGYSNYKPINYPYYEAYSTNYIDDGLKIIQFIKSLNNDKLSYVEYYPFFQFYGFNVVIFYEDTPILYLYSNNKRCIPYKRVTITENGGNGDSKKEINIGSFDFNILHALIILVKVRVDNVDNWNDLLYKYISNIVQFRDTYLKKYSKTIYDDTIFQSFVIECTGEIIPPDRERRLRIEVKKKLGKPYIYKYDPVVSKNGGSFIFLNSSGNRINNKANLKLVESHKNNKNIELELEENEEKEE